jgi:hypothetical protein
VTRVAEQVERGDDALLDLAVIAAAFDKDDPQATVDRLAAAQRAATTPLVRDRTRFLATLAGLWGGGERESGCASLAQLAKAAEASTRRLAAPIHGELCR